MKDTLVAINDLLVDIFPGGEVGRKLVHCAGAAFPALYILPFVAWIHVTVLLVLVTSVVVILEFLRLRYGLQLFLYELLLREYEEDSPAAYMLYMVSMTVVAVLFDPMIAIPAILMLALADPFVGFVSDDQLRRVKRPAALAAMFVVCAVIALPFAYEAPLAVVLGALGGTIADGVKPTVAGFVLDDDLTIAPLGALGLWVGTHADTLSLATIPILP